MPEALIILLIIAIHCVNEIIRAAELAAGAAHGALKAVARKITERLADTA